MSGPLAGLYDGWWARARPAFEAGRASVDPFLAGTAPDARRGLTLVIKPRAGEAARLAAALEPLAAAEPGQYVYAPSELHVTFLSLISGAPGYRRPEGWDGYLAAVREALRGIAPFGIALRGLTATEEAVMIQGFPEDDALNRARDLFRERFAATGQAGTLDQRFRATSAHLTALRFRQAPRDLPALAARIEALRKAPLGRIEVEEVELVESDWYHSTGKVERLASFSLA